VKKILKKEASSRALFLRGLSKKEGSFLKKEGKIRGLLRALFKSPL
jgi:hypothetical protein